MFLGLLGVFWLWLGNICSFQDNLIVQIYFECRNSEKGQSKISDYFCSLDEQSTIYFLNNKKCTKQPLSDFKVFPQNLKMRHLISSFISCNPPNDQVKNHLKLSDIAPILILFNLTDIELCGKLIARC